MGLVHFEIHCQWHVRLGAMSNYLIQRKQHFFLFPEIIKHVVVRLTGLTKLLSVHANFNLQLKTRAENHGYSCNKAYKKMTEEFILASTMTFLDHWS